MQRSAIRVMDREHTIEISDNAPEDVPSNVIAEAKAALGQRVSGELAGLVWDSLVDEGAPSWHHHLRFEHPSIWIEVSATVASGWSSLHGVMHPAVPNRIELHSAQREPPIVAEVIRSAFRIERFPRGLVRLSLVGPSETSVVYTDWFYV
jgi:hypothetical protein